jgi:hypothetical protein
VSDFFETPPPSAEPRFEARVLPQEEWLGPPRTAVPAVVPAERELARTDEVSVALGRFWVYPAGIEFEVYVDADDEWSELDPFDNARFRGSQIRDASPDRLRIGFEFANGARVTTGGGDSAWMRDGEESPTLISRSGGGGGGHWDKQYWLWPIPPPGQLEFVCEWSAAGIALTRSALDSAAIIDAASRAQTVFPTHQGPAAG